MPIRAAASLVQNCKGLLTVACQCGWRNLQQQQRETGAHDQDRGTYLESTLITTVTHETPASMTGGRCASSVISDDTANVVLMQWK